MGHDIQIVDKNGEIITTTYISNNFSELCRKYGGIHEMHGHTGKTVARIANKVIVKLLDEGYRYTVPQLDINWLWGLRTMPDGNTVRMEEKEFNTVYLHHMSNLRLLAELYYNYRFFSDQILITKRYIDSEYYSEGEEVDEETEREDEMTD